MVKADTEKDVISILKRNNVWNNEKYWRNYGDEESNFSVIGNQQSSSDRALIEKITNSIDAILMRECLKAGINPEDKEEAPKSIESALNQFFGWRNGKLSDLTVNQQKDIAENIQVVATGLKTRPSIAIIDTGEGQTPKNMPNTFLSLIKSNKARIKFVQGSYNQGSTGALKFCGNHNLQLILTKRHPNISDIADPTSKFWGFTIIRKFPPVGQMKNVVYRYLVVDSEVPKFKSDQLTIRPEYGGDGSYIKSIEWGSYVKMYEYDLPSGIRANVYKDLVLRLDTLLPEPALPAMIYERRDYKGEEKKYPGYLRGIYTKLEEKKAQDLENNFPSSGIFNVDNSTIKYTIFAFKSVKRKKYFSRDAIIYTLIGQSHGFAGSTFLTRKNVKLSHIKDNVIVIVDCSHMPRDQQTNLFMTSRDRLVKGDLKRKLERNIERILKGHEGLRKLNSRKKSEKADEVIQDHNIIRETLQEIIQEPVLSDILHHGRLLRSPFDTRITKFEEEFPANKFPSYFRLKKEFPMDKPKHGRIGRKVNVGFETDVENEYFTRNELPGKLRLFLDELEVEEGLYFTWELWNGNFTLKIKEDYYVQEGEILKYSLKVSDDRMIRPFVNDFYVKMEKPPESKDKEQKIKKKSKKKKSKELDPPNVYPVYQDKWEKNQFNEYSAGYAIYDADNFDIYINMDCTYLKAQLIEIKEEEADLYSHFYKTSISIFIIFYVNHLVRSSQNKDEESEEEIDIEYETRLFSDSIAPSIIPLIRKILKSYEDMN